MARLQDFPSVTPTDSDKVLIVQSQGQGLATFGSTIGAKMNKANPVGSGSLSLNRKGNTTVGDYSTAVGLSNEASGNCSYSEGRDNVSSNSFAHSEGRYATASNQYTHAEGYQTTASGAAAHAEGSGNTASGLGSHCEGFQNTASGDRSHAEGGYTVANHRSQHVFGEFNVADTSTAAATSRGNYAEIVGNGSSDSNRSNARTLDWNGNETIAGNLTQSSDARLKEVKNDDIPDVSSIKAVRFTWRKGTGRDFNEHIGYLAQDVEQVLPFLVKEDAEGNKALDYIAFLVAKIDSLEKRISELEKGE